MLFGQEYGWHHVLKCMSHHGAHALDGPVVGESLSRCRALDEVGRVLD